MIIDNERKFVFVAIAKTACTSIHRRFGINQDPVPGIFHMHLEDILRQNPSAKNYYKFAFVRNPYDRLVSAFYNLRFSAEHREWAYPIYEYNTFEDFVLNIEESGCLGFIHLSTQFDFLQVGGKVDIDHIGKYENLNEDFRKVERDLKVPHVELPITRVSHHPSSASLYTNEMRKKVLKIYGIDFEAFHYEK